MQQFPRSAVERFVPTDWKSTTATDGAAFRLPLSEDTPITWHHTKIALSALQKGYNIAITYTGDTKETYPVQLEQVVKVEVLNDTI